MTLDHALRTTIRQARDQHVRQTVALEDARRGIRHCKGCGCPHQDRTPRCTVCWERHANHKRRAAKALARQARPTAEPIQYDPELRRTIALGLRAQGWSYPQIGQALGIHHTTVMYHCLPDFRARSNRRATELKRRKRAAA